MIRPVTMVTFLAFIGSGLYLYQVKHAAQLVDRQIRQIEETTQTARARAGVLRAEYALLNDPDRLAQLAAAYVPELKPTQPAQWSSMADIDRRLPPVGGPAAEPGPLEPDAHPVPMARVEPARPQAVAAVPTAASQPAAPPPVVAAVAPPRAAPAPIIASAAVAKPAPRLVARVQPSAPALPPLRVNLAHGQPAEPPPPLVQVAAAPLPAPRLAPSLLPRVSAPATGTVFAAAARPATRDVSYVTPPAAAVRSDAPVPMVASALGMARTMLTVSPANAATLYPQSTVR